MIKKKIKIKIKNELKKYNIRKERRIPQKKHKTYPTREKHNKIELFIKFENSKKI